MIIGLMTCREEPVLYDDDVALLESLLQSGILAEPVIWDDPMIDYSKYGFLIVRSVWDYHYRPEEFRSWLRDRDAEGICVLNPTCVIRSNMNKRYLKQIQDRGVPIIPSLFFDAGSAPLIDDICTHYGQDELVIKPMIGASAHNLRRVSRGMVFDWAEYNRISSYGFIVQPFLQEVMAEGEVSLIYFNRVFSHAVKKIPNSGDFRVQDDYGGTFCYFDADVNLIQQGNRVLDCWEDDLLFARVDGLYTNGRFCLMEVELIEPILYLHSAHFRETFVQAIAARCGINQLW